MFVLVLVALVAGAVGLYANSTATAQRDQRTARRVAAAAALVSVAGWAAAIVTAAVT